MRDERAKLSEHIAMARRVMEEEKAARKKYLEKLREEVDSFKKARERADIAKQDQKAVLGNLRKANKYDYLDWLSHYSKHTNHVFTHHYDYSFKNGDFYVALNDFTIVPLYGANSINIIVPEHVLIEGELGHVSLFLHGDKPEAIGHWVPYYSDLDGVSEHNEI